LRLARRHGDGNASGVRVPGLRVHGALHEGRAQPPAPQDPRGQDLEGHQGMTRRSGRVGAGAALATLALPLAGCGISPPRSQVPDADAAIARLRATGSCGAGVQATAKIDHFGERGRVRGDLMMYAVAPARVRMDVVSPFGVAIATLTSDGAKF